MIKGDVVFKIAPTRLIQKRIFYCYKTTQSLQYTQANALLTKNITHNTSYEYCITWNNESLGEQIMSC